MAVDWVQSDATVFETPKAFDAAIGLCEGALGLLGSEDDPFDHDLAILRNIRTALKPKAPVMLTVLNGIATIRRHCGEDVRNGKFNPHTMVETHDEEWQMANGLKNPPGRERSFVPTELALMLRHTGFDSINIWGGTAGNWGRRPVDPDEIEIMAVARKSADV